MAWGPDRGKGKMKVGSIRGEGKGVKERNENEEFFRHPGRKRKSPGM